MNDTNMVKYALTFLHPDNLCDVLARRAFAFDAVMHNSYYIHNKTEDIVFQCV